MSYNGTNSSETQEARSISLNNPGLYAAASSGYDGCCPPVVDPYTLLALLVGIALATYFLNVLIAVTMFGGKKRKKREDEDVPNNLHRLLIEGLEEFDDNFNDSNNIIDIKEEMANNDLPWYISLLQSLVKLKEETEDEQKCEAIYNYNSLKFNDTALHDDLAAIPQCEQRLKTLEKMNTGEGKCTTEVWRCFSSVLEKMIKYVEDSDAALEMMEKLFYKATFHRNGRTLWSSVMEIPELASIARCTKEHDQCVTDRVLSEAAHRWTMKA